MNAVQLTKAIEECDSVFLMVSLAKGEPPQPIKWRDKSKAIRTKIRVRMQEMIKENPKVVFQAEVVSTHFERVLVIGAVA